MIPVSAFPSLELIAVLITIGINFSVALNAFRSNQISATNKLFFSLSITSFTWLVLAYFVRSGIIAETVAQPGRIAIAFGAALSVLIFLFARTVPKKEIPLARSTITTLGVVTIFVAGFALAPETANPGVMQKILEFGKSAISSQLLTIFSVAFLALALISLLKRAREVRNPEDRYQIKITLASLFVFAVLSFSTILLELLITRTDFYILFIPLYSIIFLGLTASVLVHKEGFQLKTLMVEGLTIFIWVLLLTKILPSKSFFEVSADITLLIAMLAFGLFLMHSMSKTIEQKEKLKALTDELTAANKNFKKADSIKNEFLSFASHDLKSPVAKMKQWATLIQDHSISDPEKITDTAFKIKTTGEQALRLVDEFLSLRQIQEQKLDYFIATHDIVPFLRQIVNEFLPIAHGRKLTLETNIPEKQIAVNYDAIKLRQVFDNILDNAIKYTKEGGIVVTCTEDEDSVTVSVKDTGPGIKEELLERLFTEFQRDKESKKVIKGTGLGLFIAKKILRGHKGEIWAESEGEGKGSTFFVRLPKA